MPESCRRQRGSSSNPRSTHPDSLTLPKAFFLAAQHLILPKNFFDIMSRILRTTLSISAGDTPVHILSDRAADLEIICLGETLLQLLHFLCKYTPTLSGVHSTRHDLDLRSALHHRGVDSSS
jgi:hypothetical protein